VPSGATIYLPCGVLATIESSTGYAVTQPVYDGMVIVGEPWGIFVE
jgi:hypothetical protein